MTTSPTQFLSEINNLDQPIPEARLAYFRARFRSRFYQFVMHEFLKVQKERGFKKADLARRLAKKPEQITRWLSEPGNWTFDTASDLLLGCGVEPRMYGQPLVAGAVLPADEDWARSTVATSHVQSANVIDLAARRQEARSAREAASPAPDKTENKKSMHMTLDVDRPNEHVLGSLWEVRPKGGAAAAGGL